MPSNVDFKWFLLFYVSFTLIKKKKPKPPQKGFDVEGSATYMNEGME
jgi:hypothetical protein